MAPIQVASLTFGFLELSQESRIDKQMSASPEDQHMIFMEALYGLLLFFGQDLQVSMWQMPLSIGENGVNLVSSLASAPPARMLPSAWTLGNLAGWLH